jgi:hypothetical protein
MISLDMTNTCCMNSIKHTGMYAVQKRRGEERDRERDKQYNIKQIKSTAHEQQEHVHFLEKSDGLAEASGETTGDEIFKHDLVPPITASFIFS